MIVTVEEAKQLWCPMTYDTQCTCLANGCMFWRLEFIPDERLRKRVEAIHDIRPDWTAQECYDSLPKRGFCGLAGIPIWRKVNP